MLWQRQSYTTTYGGYDAGDADSTVNCGGTLLPANRLLCRTGLGSSGSVLWRA